MVAREENVLRRGGCSAGEVVIDESERERRPSDSPVRCLGDAVRAGRCVVGHRVGGCESPGGPDQVVGVHERTVHVPDIRPDIEVELDARVVVQVVHGDLAEPGRDRGAGRVPLVPDVLHPDAGSRGRRARLVDRGRRADVPSTRPHAASGKDVGAGTARCDDDVVAHATACPATQRALGVGLGGVADDRLNGAADGGVGGGRRGASRQVEAEDHGQHGHDPTVNETHDEPSFQRRRS